MAEIRVHETTAPSGRVLRDWEWIGDGPVEITGSLILVADDWDGPRQPFIGAWAKFGPYNLRCIGRDDLRDVYMFEKVR